jgi:glycosyltransferase involved in cell wall biosynthesis
MISVVIATSNSERAMLPTLSALVAGAVEGLITEVIVADRGSRDGIAVVADGAGCKFMVVEGPLGRALKTAAADARAPWLLFLRPGTLLDAAWISDATRFVERPAKDAGAAAAAFRRGTPARAGLREAWSLVAQAFGALPRPEQGLLIAHAFYDALGGHSESAADPEADLIRRIGRRRLVTLAALAQDT